MFSNAESNKDLTDEHLGWGKFLVFACSFVCLFLFVFFWCVMKTENKAGSPTDR